MNLEVMGDEAQAPASVFQSVDLSDANSLDLVAQIDENGGEAVGKDGGLTMDFTEETIDAVLAAWFDHDKKKNQK